MIDEAKGIGTNYWAPRGQCFTLKFSFNYKHYGKELKYEVLYVTD